MLMWSLLFQGANHLNRTRTDRNLEDGTEILPLGSAVEVVLEDEEEVIKEAEIESVEEVEAIGDEVVIEVVEVKEVWAVNEVAAQVEVVVVKEAGPPPEIVDPTRNLS